MINTIISALLFAVNVSPSVPQATNLLRDQLVEIAGDLSEVQSTPSVHAAAKEYIIGRSLAAQDRHGEALLHFRRSAEIDNQSSSPWVGIAVFCLCNW